MHIVTKIGTDRDSSPPTNGASTLRTSAARSTKAAEGRLRRDVVDVVLLHNPRRRNGRAR